MITSIQSDGRLLAVIISHRYDKPGVSFFTPDELSQQLAYMHHPSGHVIPPHVHNPVHREVKLTQETLFIRRGKLRVDFYDDHRIYVESRVLEAGDAVLLVQGGHGFEVLEELEMFEVKQGPYTGDHDKSRFDGVLPQELNYGTAPVVLR
jgi:mannose-6-phosphate isomerase-like protein (cupin superfamily)